MHPLHTKGPFLDLLHGRWFVFEKRELLSNLGGGIEDVLLPCPCSWAACLAPPPHSPHSPTPHPTVARMARFYLEVLPGTYALSSVDVSNVPG